MNEAAYRVKLVKKILRRFPGSIVLKNDPDYIQGIPDLLVLIESSWAALEVKMDFDSPVQPNQAYYIEKMGAMSFAAFINPYNEEEVLNELQLAFGSYR